MRNIKPDVTPVTAINEVKHGEVLSILSGLKIIHTPGHSAGHIFLLLEKNNY
ncbi:MAG: hypothetical protein H0W62_07150 [Chitinophagales bacterium]|nr:hypothetical protein [Chitinophagales bacterium]